MRILQVCASYDGGGAGRVAYSLHRAYLARGHDSHLAVGRLSAAAPGVVALRPMHRAFSTMGMADRLERWMTRSGGQARGRWRLRPLVDCLRTSMPRLKWRLGLEDFNFPGSRTLLDLLPDRPEILHLHNLHGRYFDMRVLPDLSSKVPVCMTMHDMHLLTGHCAHSLECTRWRSGCGRCPHLDNPPSLGRDGTAWNWRRKRNIYARSRLHVVTPSRWLMDQVGHSMLPTVSRSVIPNGVDQSLFRPGDKRAARAALGWASGVPVILYVAHFARTNPYKDYAMIEATMRELGHRATAALTCVCVGEEGVPLQFGNARVEFAGYRTRAEELVPCYQAADVFVHAAKADTFPTTVLEAMSCGVPVVATAVGGVPEQVVEGVTGYLVPPGDVRMMAARIQGLLDRPAAAEAMGSRAQAVARERFGLDKMAGAYVSFYERMLSSRIPCVA